MADTNLAPAWLLRVVRSIDKFTDITGSWLSWLVIPLVFVVAWEVVARYLFNAPTEWAFDMTYMLYGTLFMVGSAYTLLKGAHIRTDFFWEKWSARTKGTIDAIAYLFLFLPGLLAFFFIGMGEFIYSFGIGETSEQTPWRPILWPLKGMIPLAMLLLLIQGVSEFLKSWWAAKTGIELDHKEKVEV
jgi:TRAP-type mannitol/chloroaromatic compound transport system permease small subunit